MSFQNKVVVVTGASSGIGAATASELTKQGADVVMVARNQTKLDKVAADCEKIGKKPLVINADLVKDEDLNRVIEDTIARYGKIDVLINNAGFSIHTEFGKPKSVSDFDKVMALNLRAVVSLTNLAVPHLIKTKGNVVNISSVAALRHIPGTWAYCVAKAGVDHFSRCIAAELAPKGIRVNTVNPGPVKTDFVENMGVKEGSDEIYKSFAERTALKRVSEPSEIADVVLFLASDKARGVTGASWVSDDGILLL